jgi:arsenic resistance protein ArsH
MRTIFALTCHFLRPSIRTKTSVLMGSIIVPSRGLRTLAQCSNLSISEKDDDAEIRTKYRPFLLESEVESKDWISELELETAISMAEADLAKTGARLKVLVLYGSLRKR